MLRSILAIGILLACLPAPAGGQADEGLGGGETATLRDRLRTDFQATVRELYDFDSAEITGAAKTQKSRELDQLWSLIEVEPDVFLPPLRDELQSSNAASFFYFDGSRRLLDVSDLREDQAIALAALERCDPGGFEGAVYVQMVHGLATNGLDTTVAALNILDVPGFTARFGDKEMLLGQDTSLYLMLMPLPEDVYQDRAMARFDDALLDESQVALLGLLWNLVDADADGFIEVVSTDADRTYTVRTQARGHLDRTARLAEIKADRLAELERLVTDKVLPELDATSFREARREVIGTISTESLMHHMWLTMLMRADSNMLPETSAAQATESASGGR